MNNCLPISVNICSLNEADRISRCLQSVIRNRPAEIILVDGGSNDSTVKIAKGMGVKVITLRKKGLASQRQIALGHSTQQYVAILDCDDVIQDNFLRDLLRELINFKFDAIGAREIPLEPRGYIAKAMGFNNQLITYRQTPSRTNMVGRPALYIRESLNACGFNKFFDGAGCEDTDLSIRMEQLGLSLGIGTATAEREQTEGIADFFRKVIKYGKGDARICICHPNKTLDIVKHQLVNYCIRKSFLAIVNYKLQYIPFFVLFGVVRHLAMISEFLYYIKRGVFRCNP